MIKIKQYATIAQIAAGLLSVKYPQQYKQEHH